VEREKTAEGEGKNIFYWENYFFTTLLKDWYDYRMVGEKKYKAERSKYKENLLFKFPL